MTTFSRVLPPSPATTLDEYISSGGGAGLERARVADPDAIVAEIEASGLRGRGGAGFPTGRKWRTVRQYGTGAASPTTVVVNGAEGEPGSFKDRSIMRANPFAVVEGALIAADTVGARRIVIALKSTFTAELEIMRRAVAAAEDLEWTRGIAIEVFAGPPEYLFGEETGLLEAIEGRPPFPRIAPPFRRGVDDAFESGATADGLAAGDEPAAGSGATKSAAGVELAGPNVDTSGAPTLVDNVETLANVPTIVRDGADWFRSVGTADSPGTIVCTVSGQTPRHGVGEFPMGTSLRAVLETIGGVDVERVGAVLVGVSNAVLDRSQLDVALTYEDFARIGSGLGTAGFIVYDESVDVIGVAAAASRFLAVESCGQCTPCKADGLTIADGLAAVVAGETTFTDAQAGVADALRTVADGARCNLASQQQAVVGSILDELAPSAGAGTTTAATPGEAPPVVGIRDLVDGRFELDTNQLTKQPDWTFDETDSGQFPADRLGTPVTAANP